MTDAPIWPRILVSACIVDAYGRVLVTRHAPSMKWHLPDGDLRRGERIADAVRRSVKEDLGIDVVPDPPPFLVTEAIAPSGAPHYVTLHVAAAAAAGMLARIVPASGIDLRFFAPSRAPDGPMLASTRAALLARFGWKV